MHILLLTDQYPPEVRAISLMIQELAEGLALKKHEVTVVASYPRPSLLDEGAKEAPPEVTTEGGVRVIRVRTHHYRAANYLMRGLGELLLPYLFLSKVKSYVSKGVDAVVVYTPPLA